MTSFYEKTVQDGVLGPLFTDELGDDLADEAWVEHVELLADFWLAQLLGEDTYYGDFIGAHAKMPHIKRENYALWLKLFSAAADEVYAPDVAAVFKKKAKQFVSQFLTTEKQI